MALATTTAIFPAARSTAHTTNASNRPTAAAAQVATPTTTFAWEGQISHASMQFTLLTPDVPPGGQASISFTYRLDGKWQVLCRAEESDCSPSPAHGPTTAPFYQKNGLRFYVGPNPEAAAYGTQDRVAAQIAANVSGYETTFAPTSAQITESLATNTIHTSSSFADVSFTWQQEGTASFTVPKDLPLGPHYLGMIDGSRPASYVAPLPSLYVLGPYEAAGWWTSGQMLPFNVPTAYVALGDSYASGEGAPPFAPGSDTTADHCHRSRVAGAALFAADPGPGIAPMPLRHVACSGAKIKDFLNGMNGEPPQMQALDPYVRVVSLSIGGNDVGFRPILESCGGLHQAVPLAHCEHFWKKTVNKRLKTLDSPRIYPGLPKLRELYEKIQAAAPNARRLLVVGYPHLFSGKGGLRETLTDLGPRELRALRRHHGVLRGCYGIGVSDQRWMNRVVDRGNAIIRTNAERAGATFVDLVPAFKDHGLCDRKENWINGLRLGLQGAVISQSFHPNGEGQKAIARALRNAFAAAP